MKKVLLVGVVLMFLAGCNGFTATYKDGTHWGFLESPTAMKCLDMHMDEGRIEATGLWSYIQGLLIEGKGVDYKSTGEMCKSRVP